MGNVKANALDMLLACSRAGVRFGCISVTEIAALVFS